MVDELDRTIDAALAAPPANVHLAQRVLARVEAAPRRSPWRWVMPSVAAAAAVVWVAIAVWPDLPLPPPAPLGTTLLRTVPLRAPRQEPPVAAHSHRVPQSATFPTPSPLSAEERALLRLAATPEAFAKPFTGDPIEIAPIEITPLAPAGGAL